MTQQTIDTIMDIAKARNGYKSDLALARALGFKGNGVNYWRSKKTWPSEESMVLLCELAGIDPAEGLIQLAIWRNMNSPVASIYQKVLKTLHIWLIGLIFALSPTDASARTYQGQITHLGTIHYATIAKLLAKIKSHIKALAPFPYFQPA